MMSFWLFLAYYYYYYYYYLKKWPFYLKRNSQLMYRSLHHITVNSHHAWPEFWNLHVSFEHCQRDFKVSIEISLVCWWYKAMNFSLCYRILGKQLLFPKYFESFFFFQLTHLFKKISREMFKIPSLENTGHAWHRLTLRTVPTNTEVFLCGLWLCGKSRS